MSLGGLLTSSSATWWCVVQTEEGEGEEVGRMFLQLAKEQFPGRFLKGGEVEEGVCEVLSTCVARRIARSAQRGDTSAEGDRWSKEVFSVLDFRDPCAYSVVRT